ncbi:MAG: YfhO family protein [Bacteroidota bacterium]|nr:YfhO family protein [Bacteroidota bacterium]
MKEKINLKNFVPHIIAILAFFVIMAFYFSPAMEGKVLKQHDIVMAKSMQSEITDYGKKTDGPILWTNSIFGGMPTYQIWMRYPNNISTHLMRFIKLKFLPAPFGSFFIYFICFYIFMLVLRIRPELAFIGGVAFAFSSYNLINIEAGHITKGLAVGFAPLVLSGIILALRKKYLLGLIITAIALALEIRANHLQITYYLFIMIMILLIVDFVRAFKEKQLPDFFKASVAMLIGLILAISVNITSLWTTQEYSKLTMRGGSDLKEKQKDGEGLEKDYALSWSYGTLESFTLLVPGFSGGASAQALSESSHTFKELVNKGVSQQQARTYIKSMPTYWGAMRSTSGPIYIGSVIIFLFVLGMFIVKDRKKWWLFATAILALFLAMGENFPVLTDLFFKYFPLYNKFRVPMTLLLIVSLSVPILSMLTLEKIVKKDVPLMEFKKALKYSLYGVGSILLVFILFGGSLFSFSGVADQQLAQGDNAWLVDVLKQDRARMLRIDSLRSLIFILLVAGSIYLYYTEKLKIKYFYAIVGLVILIDLVGVGSRYFNKDDFHRKQRRNQEVVAMRASDQAILQDPDINYRVMDLTVNPWNDASPAYYHKFIGGYHGAKLARYQDMIEHHLTPELQALISDLREGKQIDPAKIPVYNMLNTKYFIASAEQRGIIFNKNHLGNAWFIEEIKLAKNPDQEINAMKGFDPDKTAIVDEKFANQFEGFIFKKNDLASIVLTEYHPNHLNYQSNSSTDQIAVFSEIYYSKGWNAYIDGKLVNHFRANYILRAMKVPAGKHNIEFKFEPKSYFIGSKISLTSSIILVLLVIASIFYYQKDYFIKSKVEEIKEGNK